MFELTATAMWVLGGLLTVIFVLINKFVLDKIHKELDIQRSNISEKVSLESFNAMEARWKEALADVKDTNEKVIDKLSSRHDKEIEDLETRLGARIDRSEANVITQIRLMMEAFAKNNL